MSEPVVMTVTSIALVGNEIPNALGFGLWGSLHAVAASSTTNAAAQPLRPTVRTTRLLQLGVHRSRGARTGPPACSGTQPTQHRIATPSPTWSTKSLLLLRRHCADTPQSGVAPASHRHQGSAITSRRHYRT